MTLYSFGAVQFKILIVTPGGDDEAEVTEVHIPGSDVNYVDIGGMRPNHVELSLYFALEATYTSLRALVGTQATLIWTGGTDANTALVSLRRTWRGMNGECKANAVFIVP